VVETVMRKQLEQASPDQLRAMVKEFAEALMGAEADALCGAAYGERSLSESTSVRLPRAGLGHARRLD
jgi:putative transposase